ncbi:MAG: FAD-linked oxidoreductase [Pseudomonadales bacterium]|jgi:FAD-linked oxidoreductase
MIQRREFIKKSLTLAVGAAAGATLSGCGEPSTELQTPISFTPGKPLPWVNWAGNHACIPKVRYAPRTEDEVASILKNSTGTVRPVGASHSFSAIVPTDDTFITTDLLKGLVSHNPETLEAELMAGTRMHAVGEMLASVGQAMPNMPDMNYPSMGGAIATSVHATGTEFGSTSSYVTGLTLATPSGDLIDCDRQNNSEIFQAARASIGALGVVTKMRIQNQKPFELTEFGSMANTEEVLENWDSLCEEYRHYEILPIPYSSLSLSVGTRLAKPGDKSSGEDDPQAVHTLRSVFESVAWVPGIGQYAYDKILNIVAKDAGGDTVRTGRSFDVFPHSRIVRFREMEYTVPAEVGAQCLREVLAIIKKKKLPLFFPLEYRVVKGDDAWLSMFHQRDGAAISVHQYGDLDYKAPFAEIEPIFWKYGGRPHWGKIHTLDDKRLAELYPHWSDFQEVRRELDPSGKMLNTHLKTLFGA